MPLLLYVLVSFPLGTPADTSTHLSKHWSVAALLISQDGQMARLSSRGAREIRGKNQVNQALEQPATAISQIAPHLELHPS